MIPTSFNKHLSTIHGQIEDMGIIDCSVSFSVISTRLSWDHGTYATSNFYKLLVSCCFMTLYDRSNQGWSSISAHCTLGVVNRLWDKNGFMLSNMGQGNTLNLK